MAPAAHRNERDAERQRGLLVFVSLTAFAGHLRLHAQAGVVVVSEAYMSDEPGAALGGDPAASVLGVGGERSLGCRRIKHPGAFRPLWHRRIKHPGAFRPPWYRRIKRPGALRPPWNRRIKAPAALRPP